METNDKKEYELGYLVKTEADAAAPMEVLRELGAEVIEERPVSHLKLAYEIEKQTEALFGTIIFAAEPAKAKELEEKLRLENRVLRSIILTPPPMRAGKREMGAPGERPRATERAARPAETRPAPLSNEALEKKIEEILQ